MRGFASAAGRRLANFVRALKPAREEAHRSSLRADLGAIAAVLFG
jgi:hypothetical protein